MIYARNLASTERGKLFAEVRKKNSRNTLTPLPVMTKTL